MIRNPSDTGKKQHEDAADRAKNLFLAGMFHEIRTPINSIMGMNEMILRESTEEDIRAYAMGSQRSARALLSIISDILDYSDIESGRMEIVPVKYRLKDVVLGVLNIMSPLAAEKGLQLSLDADPSLPSELYGDDVRLKQILSNLVSNSVKYTNEGSISVTVSGERDDGCLMLKMSVADTGIGIKPENIDKLFDAFSRFDQDSARQIEGTGLGLNITHSLLNMMGSRLTISSEYGAGSVFSFTVRQEIVSSEPVGMIETVASEEERSSSAMFCAPQASILVVDDNDMNRKVFKSLLKRTGVRITEADSGMKCLSLAENKHFDMIFLDHMMPVMDGIETFHRLRELEDCVRTPIIALTANAVSGARERYLSEGFTDFLSKPVSSEGLERMILRYLPEELITELQAEETVNAEIPSVTLPEIEGFNYNIARLYAADDYFLLCSLEMFGESLSRTSALLRYYFPIAGDSAENLDMFRIQAHALKGTAAMVGAMQVSELAKTAEFAAKASDMGRINAITPILLDEAEKCLERVQAAGLHSPKPAAEDISALPEKLARLISLMDEFMLDEADGLMEEIYSFSYPDEIQPLIEIIKIAEVNCDSPSAAAAAEKLSAEI